MNHILSILGFLLLVVQPFASLYLIKETKLRNNLLTFYSICSFVFVVYNTQTTYIQTSITPRGHLPWNWSYYIWLPVSFYFSLSYTIKIIYLIFLFLFFTLFHFIGKGAGSLWCLFVNSMIIYF